MPEPTTEPVQLKQEAIHVSADDFPAVLKEMGPDAYGQRFTVSNKPKVEANVPDGVEKDNESVPIDVTAEQLSELTFGDPRGEAIQNWLAANAVTPGDVITVRMVLPEGVVEKRVSTNLNNFFSPVVDMPETDEFENAQVVAKKYPIGTIVTVGRNVYGADNKPTGEKTPDAGWKVIGYGEKNGKPTTKIQKIVGDTVLDKEQTTTELEEMQRVYSPENQRPPIPERIARKTGHQELEAAGVDEPKANTSNTEIDETTKPRETSTESAVTEEVTDDEKKTEPEPEKTVDKKQERYNEIKKAMEAVIEEVSDTSAGYTVLDALRLDDNAKAVYSGDHNAEARAVAGMSKKLISRTDLINRYADLYKLREELFILRA